MKRSLLIASLLLFLPALSVGMPPAHGPNKGALAPAASAVPDVTTGLIAWIKMDETSGTSAADSAGSHAGTTVNSPTWASPGLTFDGSTQYCTLASPPIIGDRTAFTLSVWFKTTAMTTGDVYMEGRSISNSSEIFIAVNTDAIGDVKFAYRDGPGTWEGFTTSPLSINDGNWHHAAMVQSAKNSRTFYVDGSVVGTNTTAASSLTLDLSTIGSDFQNATRTHYLNGTAKYLRIYSRALSSTDVSYLFTNGL